MTCVIFCLFGSFPALIRFAEYDTVLFFRIVLVRSVVSTIWMCSTSRRNIDVFFFFAL